VVVFLAISLLLAVALDPLVALLGRHRISRGVSVGMLAAVVLAIIVTFMGLVLPPVAQQAAGLVAELPAFHDRVIDGLPARNPMLRAVVDQVFGFPSSPQVMALVDKPLIWGGSAVSGIMTTGIVLVTTLYLLLDGKAVYVWLLAYVPREHRDRMADTVSQVSEVVYAYVRGQVVTSVLFAVFVGIVLTLLGVPAVWPLAILAAACDVIPVAGIILATVPAILLALTVSPLTAAAVLGSYAVYHLIEAYLIVPRVYGKTLRLSTLAVLLALIVGGTLQGIVGAVLVLPLVAAYPIIERIWLKGYLAPAVIEDHEALATAADTGSDSAVDAVLQGEDHPAA
jgi:predicted PurR-regulated permease PerM